MRKHAFPGLVLAATAAFCCALPASHAQNASFRFEPPAMLRAVSGVCEIGWYDDDTGLDEGLKSITWYYATRSDGSDRQRMVTLWRDDFSAFRSNWRSIGPFALGGWTLRRDRDLGRSVLRGDRDAGALLSSDVVRRNVVVSALVRPLGLRNEFSLGFRVAPDGRGYELQSEGNRVRVVHTGQPPLAEKAIFDLVPNQWYWYEVGLRSLKRNDLEIRVRIYDEKRERVLASLSDIGCRPMRKELLNQGLLALTGPAEFAELYVDPWEARWSDDSTNRIRWNTAVVPNGDYYIIAEICDGRTITREVSNFQIQVRNSGEALRQ